jgi:hypothetical protein
VVGFTASDHMISGYNFNAKNSVYNLPSRGKIEFTPNIYGIQMLKRAKLMDIIYSVPVPNSGIIISNKLLQAIKKFSILLETQIFDATVIFNNKEYAYFCYYIYEAKEDQIVDWNRSYFIEKNFLETIGEEFQTTKSEILKMQTEEFKQFEPTILVLNSTYIQSGIFKLDHTFYGNYITEELKNEIEEIGCIGIDFIPINELGFEVVIQ